MSHLAWDGPDIAAFWDYAEQHAAKVLSEADLHHAVSQALALVKDEPPYVPLTIVPSAPNGIIAVPYVDPNVMPAAPPIPEWERALMDEPDAEEFQEHTTLGERLFSWAVFGAVVFTGAVVVGGAVWVGVAAVQWIGGLL